MRIQDIVDFAAKLSASGAVGDFEMRLPAAAMNALRADTAALRRFNCAANAEGVLAMWGPAGVIVIRERSPGMLYSLNGVPTLRQAVRSGDLQLVAPKFARDPADCPHESRLAFAPHGELKAEMCRDCGADLVATMRRG